MVAHRLTGNKEVVSALHKLNHSISYTDVRMQNKKLAQNVSSQMKAPKSLMKRIATHVTLGNNDVREETSAGRETTHDTILPFFNQFCMVSIFNYILHFVMFCC